MPCVPPLVRRRRTAPSISDDSFSTAVYCTRFIPAESEWNSAAARSMCAKTSGSGSAVARPAAKINAPAKVGMLSALFTIAPLLLLGKRQVALQLLLAVIVNRFDVGDDGVGFEFGIDDRSGALRKHGFGDSSELLGIDPVTAVNDRDTGRLGPVTEGNEVWRDEHEDDDQADDHVVLP